MKYVKYCILPSVSLIYIARVLLVSDVLPERLNFYGKDRKNKAIETIAGELPVVFTGSFQNPSNYHFFTGKESTVLSAINTRMTQFDILQKELSYQGKPVLVCSVIPGKSQEYSVDGIKFHAFKAARFQSVNRLEIDYKLPENIIHTNDTLDITFEIFNPSDFTIDFSHPEFPVSLKAVYVTDTKKFEFEDCILLQDMVTISAHARIKGSLKTVVPELDTNVCRFALSLDNTLCCAQNSKSTYMRVESAVGSQARK
jgi:hypothetical protein